MLRIIVHLASTQPVHNQYTKGPLTALNHRYPQRPNVSNTNGLHDYQQPPATQTMTSRLSGPACICRSQQTSLQTTHAAARRLGCRGGAGGTDDDVGVLHAYNHGDLHREPLISLWMAAVCG